jgi:hypothetical protein
MNWLGAEYAIAAISDTLLPFGTANRGPHARHAAVPFPDERYRTIAVEWHRSRSQELSTPEPAGLRLEASSSRAAPMPTAAPSPPRLHQHGSWRPLVLDVRARDQREMLRVLREDPSLQVIDRLAEQRAQLSGVKPAPALARGRVRSAGSTTPGGGPWCACSDRVPFGTLRLDRNRNKLTRAEQARQRGSASAWSGSAPAIRSPTSWPWRAWPASFAWPTSTRRAVQPQPDPGSVLDLGVNKAVVAARRIGEIDPYLRVVTITEGITPENLGSFLDGLDLVIEECDSLDVKLLVREAARSGGSPC